MCDGVDNDCNGITDEGFDTDGDTFTTCGPDLTPGTDDDDCNDGSGATFPGATETCDNEDNDCDGTTDEGVTQATSCGQAGSPCEASGFETCSGGVFGSDTCTPSTPSSEVGPFFFLRVERGGAGV